MAGDPYTLRGIWSSALTGAFLIAFGCGCQAAFAPTVRVSCPARTSAAPDCDLRWLVAFDKVTIRHTPLPALQPGDEIVRQHPKPPRRRHDHVPEHECWARADHHVGRSLVTAATISGILFAAYFADAHAPAIELTMRPSNWVDPGGDCGQPLRAPDASDTVGCQHDHRRGTAVLDLVARADCDVRRASESRVDGNPSD